MSVDLLHFDNTTGDLTPVTANDTAHLGQIHLDGVGGIALNAGACLLSNVADPLAPYDAATKGYVDSVVQSYAQSGYPSDGSTTTSGPQGKDGKSILAGQPAPDNSVGNVGDLYIELDGPYLWGPKATNGWPTNIVPLRGPQGDRGVAGVPGYSIRPSPQNPPANTLGNNGDYALTAGGLLYGPRTSGAYPAQALSLVGATGKDGQSITGPQGTSVQYSASAPPDAGLGSVGDLAVTMSGQVYGPKTSSGWGSATFSIVGPKGDKGDPGAASTVPGPKGDASTVAGPKGDKGDPGAASTVPGPKGDPGAASTVAGPKGDTGAASTVPGPQGNGVRASQLDPPSPNLGIDGDYALSPTSILYGPKSAGAWPSSGVSLVGPQGASIKGDKGDTGVRGAQVLYSNNNPPAASLGLNGDFAITFDGTLYGPKSAGAWGVATLSLIGPAGKDGQSITGPRGASVLSAQADPPDNGLGLSGDFAISASSSVLYGPKPSSGTWQSGGVSLVGPRGAASTVPGPAGFSVQSGQGAPTNQGSTGDVYLDVQNGYLYPAKTASGWGSTYTSLIGPRGIQGIQGVRGATLTKLNNYSSQDVLPTGGFLSGDYVLTSDYFIFGPYSQSNGWPYPGISLVGPRGPQGTQGVQGQSITGPKGDTGAASTVPGPRGYSVDSGSGAPTDSVGVTGDAAYVDTTNAVLYGAKTASGWPTSGVLLIGPKGDPGAASTVAGPPGKDGAASTVPGPAGSQIYSGTGTPPSGTGTTGDYFLATDTYTLYGPKTSATAWPTAGLLLRGPKGDTGVGQAGAAGSQIYSGTGSPPAATGTTSDYFFSTDTYTLTGPKQSATSWSGATSTVLRGAAGNAGAAGSQIISGTGTPPAGTGTTGDYFYATDTFTLTGPKPSATSWSGATTTVLKGATGTSGNTIRNGSGAPSATTPAIAGDFYLSTSNPTYTIYGPATGGTGTYPTSGTSLVGPAGSTSTSSSVGSSGLTFNDGTTQTTAYPGPVALSTNAPTQGPPTLANGTVLTATAVNMNVAGTSNVSYFTPPTSSAFYFVGVVSYTNSAANINVQLYNLTDAVAIWTTPSAIAPGTIAKYGPFSISTYPMVANKQYVWRMSGNGASYISVYPMYFLPSSAPFCTQVPPVALLTQPTTLTSSLTATKQPGTTNLTQYYQWPTGTYFTYAIFQNFSTATAAVFVLYNNSTSATLYTSPSVPAGGTTTVGPLGPGIAPLIANNQYYWGVTGSGSATVAINWQIVG